ncbi:MAG: glycosyltransferase family 4 protein [Spirochaetota bacterium]|nr:MAG: glycosyltransferase family 4 protein [Spirochaetota bacterium]
MTKRVNNNLKIRNIGFISTRFKGTDGVSLEAEKWASVIKRMGYECYYFCGLSDRPPERTMLVPEAFFGHPKIKNIQDQCFKVYRRSSELTGKIHSMRRLLKHAIYNFVKKFHIDLIIAENCLAIPMNVPLGLALTEFIAETGMPTIAHHHDFFWERPRFFVNAIADLINMAFPPGLHSIQHVVINTQADRELSYRTGISPTVIPNVLDFKKPSPGINHYNSDLRKAFGLKEDDIFILQPTRVVARKGIEHTIEVISRLKDPKVKLVISHSTTDEGDAYAKRIEDYAEHLGVQLIIKPEIIGDKRGRLKEGEKIYTLWDVYPHADLVAYPSTYEGFGNAFIEAIYFKKPILVNLYSAYIRDIKPLGFKAIEMEGYVTDEVIEQIRCLLKDSKTCYQHAQTNFEVASRFFSYEVLARKLKNILMDFEGIVEAIELQKGPR